MGTYLPTEQKTRSLSDTLSDAEHEHLLDCPDADFFIRLGSTLLDFILCFLIFSGITHITNAVMNLSPRFVTPELTGTLSLERVQSSIFYVSQVLKLMLGYIYFVWTVATFGGSPAKLLLGLRVLDAGSGQKLSIPRAFLREVIGKAASVGLVGGGLILPLIREDRRALHDLMSNSVVKRVHGAP